MTINPMSYYALLESYDVPGVYGLNPSLLAPPAAGQGAASANASAINADEVQISALGQLTAGVATMQTAMQSLEAPGQVSGDITAAAQSLIDAYNNLLSTLSSLTGSSGSLATDPNAAQLMADLSSTLSQSFNVGGATTSLAQLGISIQPDGTLALDAGTLQSAYAADPTGTVAVLNQAALAFDCLASNYAGPGGSLVMESQTLQQSVLDQQLVVGAADTAALLAQQQGLQAYEAAMVAGFQSQVANLEFSALLLPSLLPPSSATPAALPGLPAPGASGTLPTMPGLGPAPGANPSAPSPFASGLPQAGSSGSG